jgi:uncharacterized protein
MKPNRKKIFSAIKIILLVYSVTGIAFTLLQDKIFFKPAAKALQENYNLPQPYREVNIAINATTNLNIVQFKANDTNNIKGVVLYFHGNKKNISWYAKYAPAFTGSNYEVWMMDYPGFGKSTGTLTEEILYSNAAQVYKLARSRFAKNSIIIFGKSIGTGIAAQLASVKDCKALILETPYYSLQSLVGTYLFMYPLKTMMHYNLPTYQYLPKVYAPITIFHGTSDGVIPYRNAKKLRPLLKAKDIFITIEEGTHNNLFEKPAVINKIKQLLNN